MIGPAIEPLKVVSGALLLALATTTLGCKGGETPAPTATPTPTPEPLVGRFEYEGINHVSWQAEQYVGSEGTSSREALVETGANWAGLLVTWYMETRDSATIAPDATKTPSDASLRAAIRHLHQNDVRVMLKPHVDVDDGTWRGSVLPPDTDAWFASYDAFMTHIAALAESEEVEMLCVGTELARLSDSPQRARWEHVIANVRASYGGLLTYAANANSGGDEFTSVAFWDLVDVAGLDGYVPLTSENDPTRDELIAAWSQNLNGDDMRSAFRNWQSSHGKPAVFTEIGYRSANGANISPWDWSTSASYDGGEQADCYYAAFSVFLEERSWMKGLFLWSWDVPAPAYGDTGYTPRTKPAEDVLRDAFSDP